MSEINELQALTEAIKIIESKLTTDRECMDDTSIQSMTKTIRDLNWMLSKRRHEEYVKQLKDFKDHMDITLQEYDTDIQSNIDTFYSLEFEITFNGKKVVVENNADVFNDIYRCISDEIAGQSC